MTKEEIFVKSVVGVIVQGGGSFDDIGCRYRGPNGRKCAAGQLIPDELYKPEMERKSVWSLRRDLPEILCWDPAHDDLVSSLQFAHDGAARITRNQNEGDEAFVKLFRERAKRVAEEYDVKVDVDSL